MASSTLKLYQCETCKQLVAHPSNESVRVNENVWYCAMCVNPMVKFAHQVIQILANGVNDPETTLNSIAIDYVALRETKPWNQR